MNASRINATAAGCNFAIAAAKKRNQLKSPQTHTHTQSKKEERRRLLANFTDRDPIQREGCEMWTWWEVNAVLTHALPCVKCVSAASRQKGKTYNNNGYRIRAAGCIFLSLCFPQNARTFHLLARSLGERSKRGERECSKNTEITTTRQNIAPRVLATEIAYFFLHTRAHNEPERDDPAEFRSSIAA